jgi:REP element-mobilizing transposase RayT
MAKEKLQYGRIYHIYNRGNNGENLFVERRNYPYFLQLYAHHIQPVAETYAYSLLPNHFHLAIRTRTEAEQEAYHREQIGSFFKNEPISRNDKSGPISKIGPLSDQPLFKLKDPSRAYNNLFIAYSRAFNKATKRTGALFESPFERKIVDNQRYLLTLIAYIHHNPQKHGFVDDFRDWPWTSYGAMLSDKPTKLNRDEVLAWYNGRSHFIDAHAAEPDARLIAPLLLEDWF